MFASLFVILGALLPSAMALTSEDVASIFGTTQPLTGSMVALPQFTFSVITNDSHALVTLNATEKKPEEVGWMATGVGTSMTNADMLVAWMAPTPSPIAPWVLSHREATGPTMPKVSSTAPDTMTTSFYTFLPQLSTSDPTSPYTSVSYLRPLIMPPNYPSLSSFKNLMKVKTGFIYASSSHRPASDAPDGPIGKHDEEHATVTLDLSTHIDLNHELPESEAADHHGMQSWTSEAWPLPREASEGGPLTRRDIVLAIHAALGSVSLLLFSPLAILVARYCRKLNIPWFRIHASIQVGAYSLIAIAFGLAVSSVQNPHFSNPHAILGLVIFLSLTCQLSVGWFAHKTPVRRADATPNGSVSESSSAVFESIKGKGYLRLLHIGFGLAITITGWAQIRLGLEEWVLYSDSGHEVPTVVLVVFWILIGVESAEVFLGRFMKEERAHTAALRLSAANSRNVSSIAVGTSLPNGSSATMTRLDTESRVDLGASTSTINLARVGDERRDSDTSTLVGVGATKQDEAKSKEE